VFGGDPAVLFTPEDLNGNLDPRAAALDLFQKRLVKVGDLTVEGRRAGVI
jgi:hypothetical protein